LFQKSSGGFVEYPGWPGTASGSPGGRSWILSTHPMRRRSSVIRARQRRHADRWLLDQALGGGVTPSSPGTRIQLINSLLPDHKLLIPPSNSGLAGSAPTFEFASTMAWSPHKADHPAVLDLERSGYRRQLDYVAERVSNKRNARRSEWISRSQSKSLSAASADCSATTTSLAAARLSAPETYKTDKTLSGLLCRLGRSTGGDVGNDESISRGIQARRSARFLQCNIFFP
jgi:hypothetical protein